VPEGDTIWRTAAALRSRLAGKRVESVQPEALRRLEGSTITQVEPVGKHLFIRFDSGLSLHTHMRMTGSWHLYRPGQPWLRPSRLARAVLATEDAVAVLFSAPVVELVRHQETAISHLGPDILAPELERDVLVSRARALEGRGAALGELLLDQRVACGIGNIWRCESLWEQRLDPWAPAGSLSDREIGDLYARAQRLMRASVGGSRRRSAVHGRGGRPCRRCGTPIRVRAQGRQARLTFWCPTCQVTD
jgi:endonuclease-8